MASNYLLDDIRAVYGEPWLQIPCSERLRDGWMDGALPDDVRKKCLALGDRRVHGIAFAGVSDDDSSLFLMTKFGRPFVNIWGETITNYWLWLYDDSNDTLELLGSGTCNEGRRYVRRYGNPRVDLPEGFSCPRRCAYIRKFLLPTRNVHFYEYATHSGFTLSVNGVSLEKKNPERTPALAELLDIVLAKSEPPKGTEGGVDR